MILVNGATGSRDPDDATARVHTPTVVLSVQVAYWYVVFAALVMTLRVKGNIGLVWCLLFTMLLGSFSIPNGVASNAIVPCSLRLIDCRNLAIVNIRLIS